MTLGTFVWLIFGKRIGLKERRLIMTDQNQSNLSGIVKLMKHVLVLILLIELFGGLILGTYFLKYFDSPGKRLYMAFLPASARQRTPVLILPSDSMIPFRHDYFVQFIVIMLLIFGAIGFPVLIEVKDFLLNKERKFTFSLFTKLTTITFSF
ncbi:potassium transporter TrkG [Bacillus sonorensis]|nr:potassium transporter TrkG [Bacillus sonorensis]